jgi:hypothetical protein
MDARACEVMRGAYRGGARRGSGFARADAGGHTDPVRTLILVPLLLLACAERPEPVPGTAAVLLEAVPGPAPHESPAPKTLWRSTPTGWERGPQVIAVAPGGRALVTVDRQLMRDGVRLDEGVLPDLAVGPQGELAYTKGGPGQTDVWRIGPHGPQAVTRDGRSDRPVFLPDGELLWVSSADGGQVRWWSAAGPLSAPMARVPAFPAKTRVEAGRVVFHAGDGWFALDPGTGAVTAQ